MSPQGHKTNTSSCNRPGTGPWTVERQTNRRGDRHIPSGDWGLATEGRKGREPTTSQSQSSTTNKKAHGRDDGTRTRTGKAQQEAHQKLKQRDYKHADEQKRSRVERNPNTHLPKPRARARGLCARMKVGLYHWVETTTGTTAVTKKKKTGPGKAADIPLYGTPCANSRHVDDHEGDSVCISAKSPPTLIPPPCPASLHPGPSGGHIGGTSSSRRTRGLKSICHDQMCPISRA